MGNGQSVFPGAEVVEDGIYFMYHGTKVKNVPSILQEGFRVSKNGMLGRGVYVSLDVNKAQKYGEVVLKLLVFVGKVRLVTSQDQPDRKTWQHNYDSAHVPEGCGMVRSGMTETCIKSPMYVSSLMQVVFFKKDQLISAKSKWWASPGALTFWAHLSVL